MKNPISLIWGTLIDTQFWIEFLKSLWYTKICSYSVSQSPQEQNELQFHKPELLQKICQEKISDFKLAWCEICIIYCNSLSSVLNIQQLQQICGLKLITPIDVYKTLWKQYTDITIIAANANWAQLIEKELSKLNCLSIGWLELVLHIEQYLDPQEILQVLCVKNLIGLSVSLKHDLILLGCTHFPYITKELQKISPIPVLDLNQGFKKLLE